jgi:ribosomal protein S18 acetylase RimI-like enzyme
MFVNVDPAYIGKGIASMMLAFLEERLATAISRQLVEMV